MAHASKEARAARTDLLRGVLERAVAMARGDGADDPASVPPTLRPVVKMARLAPRALAVVDRAGDDEGFRARVAAAVGDDASPAERLWLDRPEGWEARLDEMVGAEVSVAEEGDLKRQLDRERRARRGAEAARDQAAGEAEALRAEIDALKERAARASASLAEVRGRAEAADEERAAAVRSLKELEAAHARAHEELRVLREAAAAPPADGASPEEPAPAAAPEPALDREALAAAVARSTEVAASLSAALSAVAALVEEAAPDGGEEPAAAGEDSTAGDAVGVPSPPDDPEPEAEAAPPRRIRRRPARLPGGMHDDTNEAADHLVRLPGATLLVDGYNATMVTWPQRPIADQRRLLVSALNGLQARLGIDVTVVFDGVDQRIGGGGDGASRRVRVQFTVAKVEADDVIIDMSSRLPEDRVVIVASNDNRVRDGARGWGANLLTISQLQSLFR